MVTEHINGLSPEAREIISNLHEGRVEVVSGCMFAGKTEELIRRHNKTKIMLQLAGIPKDDHWQYMKVFKPIIDDRYIPNAVNSHSGGNLPAIAIPSALEIFKHTDGKVLHVAIDEAQFFDDTIVDISQYLAKNGIQVLIAGLDTDFRGNTFGPMGDLISHCNEHVQLHAMCVKCGSPANRTQRIKIVEGGLRVPANWDDPLILVGAQEDYEPRCSNHHETPGKPTKSFPAIR